MVLEGLKVDPDAARDYIVSERPTYLQFEEWVRNQPGSDTSQENIDHINMVIVERTKSDSSRRKILDANGLDDWQEIHEQLLLKS